jgi:hypothetical protein
MMMQIWIFQFIAMHKVTKSCDEKMFSEILKREGVEVKNALQRSGNISSLHCGQQLICWTQRRDERTRHAVV